MSQAEVRSKETAKMKLLMMGYTANYALWVHENIGAKFKRPGSGPKWFEAAIKRNANNIVNIVKDNAKVK